MAAVATLVAGLIIGYVAQRSRLCFVGGLRDFILVRDTELLKGVLGVVLTAWLAFPAVALLGGAIYGGADPSGVWLPDSGRGWAFIALTTAGGLGLGYFSTLANGCPLRQHVLAAQGQLNAVAYLLGFYAGAVVYHGFVLPLLAVLL